MKSKKIEETELMNKLGMDLSSNSKRRWKWVILVGLLIVLVIAIGIFRNKGAYLHNGIEYPLGSLAGVCR